MPQNRWKYPDGSVTIKLYEPFPAGESLLLKLEDKTMDYNKAALEMHETHKGKVGIVSKVEVATRDDLSTAYTPGVAEPCRKIKENPEDVYKYTFKGNMVAVVSNGTAVLGLGDIGPEAGLPVMEGKAVLFKEFGGVDASLSASTPTMLPVSSPPARPLRPPLAASIWRTSRVPSASRSRRPWSGSWTSPCSTTTSTAPPSWSLLPHQRPAGGE